MRKILSFVALFISFYSYSQSFCAGSSAVITAPNPSNVINPTYSLNPGGNTSATGSYTVSPNTTTTYTLYTTGTPSTGSGAPITTTFVTTVTLNAQPQIAPSYTQASCTNTSNAFNLNLTFNPASPVPAYTVNWGATTPINILSPTQFTAANSAAGPYSATITTAAGCSVTVNFTINPQPDPATFTVTPFGSSHTITCVQPTVVLNTNNANLTYTWSSTSFTPIPGPSISLDVSMLGTIQVVGTNPISGCTSTYTFLLTQNFTTPTSTINPTFTTLTCAQPVAPTVTVVASPSINISHFIYSPQGGTFAANAYTAIYFVGGVGEFTHCAVNNNSGCQTCKTFTINSATSATDFPTYSVSSPQNFTLGCSSNSTAVINIVNPQGAGGGAASYTLIGPPTTGTLPPTGTLSSVTVYSVTVPGTWTVVVRDNVNNCETRTPISVVQLTFPPALEIEGLAIPKVLNCLDSTTILKGLSTSTNVIGYNWSFPFVPGNFASNTLTVRTIPALPNQSVVAVFTLTGTDQTSKCINTLTVPVYQNIYRPVTKISATPTLITCKTLTVTLTNQSSTGIPSTSTLFPSSKPIAGYRWEGPSPQEPAGPSSSYVGGVPGVYTLTSMDMNNYCRSSGTLEVIDGRVFPNIKLRTKPSILGRTDTTVIDCGSATATLAITEIASMDKKLLTYTWTANGTFVSNSRTDSVLTVGTPGLKYTVLVTNSVSGCSQRSDSIIVGKGVLTSKFSTSAISGYAPLSVQFTNESSSVDTVSGQANIQTIWNFGNGKYLKQRADSFTVKPTAVFNQPGTYTVTLYVGKGVCQDTSYKVISVDIPSSLEVPNIFTPNGDGVNDLYFLKTSNLSDIDMVIYDRWGHITYELQSTSGNVAWDGKNQYGKECAEGTYFYLLKATGKDGNAYEQKGTITLVR